MVIEKLQQQHVPQVIALLQQLVPFELALEPLMRGYETLAEHEDSCVLVAREGDEILGTVSGFCCRSLVGTFLTVEDMFVREDLRGRGIGKKLMEAIEDYGHSCSCNYAVLVSSGFRERAHRFYEGLGYDHDVRGFRKFL